MAKTYCSRQAQFHLDIPVVEEVKSKDGKWVKVIEKHDDGTKRMRDGKYVYAKRNISFTNYSNSKKDGMYCEYITNDEYEIEYLDGLVAQGLLLTKDAYEERKDPTLFKLNKDAKKLAKAVEEKDKKLSELEKQLEIQKERIATLTGVKK
jgi:sorbitol-specific phosphotransferase system component IIBC